MALVTAKAARALATTSVKRTLLPYVIDVMNKYILGAADRGAKNIIINLDNHPQLEQYLTDVEKIVKKKGYKEQIKPLYRDRNGDYFQKPFIVLNWD